MGKRVLHIGAGGFGANWCREFLPRNIADGTIEVIGLVDIDPQALAAAAPKLGLGAERCFTDATAAFAACDADFCSIVVPPAMHERYVDLALAKGMDILSEKPIADTFEAAQRIVAKVRAAGRKMAVTMSHRFDQDKATLRSVATEPLIGRKNLVSCRFAADFRRFDSWRRFRHEMQHPLLIEGAVHHLDILADLAGGACISVYARTWRPAWAEYEGDTDGLVILEFDSGVRAVYEGTAAHAVGLNDWMFEYVRVDGEMGSATLDHREVELFRRLDNGDPRQQVRQGTGQKIALLPGAKWANTLLVEQFAHWLDGGPEMATEVTRNLTSLAIVFAAVESSATGRAVDPRRLLAGSSPAPN